MAQSPQDVRHTHGLFKAMAKAVKEYLELHKDANVSRITVTTGMMFLARIVEIHAFEDCMTIEDRTRFIDDHKLLVMKAFEMLKTQSTFEYED